MSLIYLFLALLVFSFLVFIHELGHYWVAKRQGIHIEVFSIGFGKPLYSWKHNGVTWQICLIPLGGYVSWKGEGEKGGPSMYEVEGGFFSKTPWARIKVLLAGPLMNIAFALIAFSAVWAMGGRMKSFEEFSTTIGAIDSKSELAQLGVKPGDTISVYNHHPYHGFRDLVIQGAMKNEMMQISGEKIDYATGETTPYNYHLPPYHREGMMKEIQTVGVLSPASILYFDGFDDKTGPYSPLWGSGIEKGDRLVWLNGEFIFSVNQMQQLLNQRSVMLTVRQNDELKTLQVPRVPIAELEMGEQEQGEFSDWRYEIGEKQEVAQLGFIPYEVDEFGVVRKPFSFIDDDLVQNKETKGDHTSLFEGDQIVAVGDQPVDSGLTLFKAMAKQECFLIVKKASANKEISQTMTWENEDKRLRESIDWSKVKTLAAQIGKPEMQKEMGEYKLIGPISPIAYKTFNEQAGITRPDHISEKLHESLDQENREMLFIGSRLQNQMVLYNPNPLKLLAETTLDTWKTLTSLFTGALSPKWLSGPVGMFKIMHDGWSVGPKEVLYWMGLISLNLGIFNLLPIPVLDGGRICLTMWEWITRRRISEKTMEMILLPFFVLLIAVFLYTTYHDVIRLIGG